MTINEATQFIRPADCWGSEPSTWADLGSGKGVFTYALAALLPAGSQLYAVDKERQRFSHPDDAPVNINFVKVNFEKDRLDLPALDGILMANSLHYISDKSSLLQRQKSLFAGKRTYIFIEYDTANSNPWVPYPINFLSLEKLCMHVGLSHVEKVAERPSRYRAGHIYVCVAQDNKYVP